MKYVFLYLTEASRGGPTRQQILKCIEKTPKNNNQIAEELSLDYKTIQHHLKVLMENSIIGTINKGGYGAVHYIHEDIKQYMKELEENWNKSGKTLKKKKG